MSRRVLVTGSRGWIAKTPVWAVLRSELEYANYTLGEELIVVHGGAEGLDDIADRWAYGMRQMGWLVRPEKHSAEPYIEAYGKKRGPLVRNEHMVDLGAVVCHAFPLIGGTGTRHCMTRAFAAGMPVVNHGFQAYTEQAREYAKVHG